MFDAPRDPELEQDDRDSAGGHQEAVALRVDTVIVAQIYRKSAVHLLISHQHQHTSEYESDKGQVFEYGSVARKGSQHTLTFFTFLRFRFGFRDEFVEECRHDAGGNRVTDEQVEVGLVGNQAAQGGTDDPGHVAHHAQDAKAFGALFFRQNVGDHGLVGRSGYIGEQAGQNSQRIEHPELVDHAEQECAQGTEDQSEQDQAATAEFVGQCAADHAAEHAEDGEEAQDDACLGHANAEFLGDVEREEREQHRSANAVDEPYANHHPEARWEFVIDFTETGKHILLSLRKTNHSTLVQFVE